MPDYTRIKQLLKEEGHTQTELAHHMGLAPATVNQKLNGELETMFLTTQAQNMYLSSSMVKDIASFGGDISSFVPAAILEDISNRLCKGGVPK